LGFLLGGAQPQLAGYVAGSSVSLLAAIQTEPATQLGSRHKALGMSKTFLAIAVAVVTSGCTTTATETSQLRGLYTWGHEVQTFIPCGSKQAFWVVGDVELLQPLQDKSAALAQARGTSYQPIYVEVTAVAQGKATDGFAADYDGVYRFVSVQVVSSQSPVDCLAHG
jgi:hypothetical protein